MHVETHTFKCVRIQIPRGEKTEGVNLETGERFVQVKRSLIQRRPFNCYCYGVSVDEVFRRRVTADVELVVVQLPDGIGMYCNIRNIRTDVTNRYLEIVAAGKPIDTRTQIEIGRIRHPSGTHDIVHFQGVVTLQTFDVSREVIAILQSGQGLWTPPIQTMRFLSPEPNGIYEARCGTELVACRFLPSKGGGHFERINKSEESFPPTE